MSIYPFLTRIALSPLHFYSTHLRNLTHTLVLQIGNNILSFADTQSLPKTDAMAKSKNDTPVKSKTAIDDLDNADRARMLSVIDQFRAFGISKDISLPQIRLGLPYSEPLPLRPVACRGRRPVKRQVIPSRRTYGSYFSYIESTLHSICYSDYPPTISQRPGQGFDYPWSYLFRRPHSESCSTGFQPGHSG